MQQSINLGLLERRYRAAYQAEFSPSFDQWLNRSGRAALGFRRADAGPLFVETYLDEPVERLVTTALGRAIPRGAIVEIGNFAAENAIAMIELWGQAANDLGDASEIAVATLTAPIRRMFARIGVEIITLAPAAASRLGGGAARWGNYYAHDPQVCAGVIAQGQATIARFVAHRSSRGGA